MRPCMPTSSSGMDRHPRPSITLKTISRCLTQEKHSLMIECWHTDFHKHAEAESTWPQFHAAYGQYDTGKHANVEIPNGHDLHARAQRATEKANGRSDGWTPSELKALPPSAWTQRAKLLKLMHEECKFPDAYNQINTPAITKRSKTTNAS